MREVLEHLRKAAALLCEVEVEEPIDQYSLGVLAKIFLAHASIKFAEAKLHLLIAQEEEPCEKS